MLLGKAGHWPGGPLYHETGEISRVPEPPRRRARRGFAKGSGVPRTLLTLANPWRRRRPGGSLLRRRELREAIVRSLNGERVVPAAHLHELGEVLLGVGLVALVRV